MLHARVRPIRVRCPLLAEVSLDESFLATGGRRDRGDLGAFRSSGERLRVTRDGIQDVTHGVGDETSPAGLGPTGEVKVSLETLAGLVNPDTADGANSLEVLQRILDDEVRMLGPVLDLEDRSSLCLPRLPLVGNSSDVGDFLLECGHTHLPFPVGEYWT
jgi:hypothetical protein